MKVLVEKEICGSYEQCMGPTEKQLQPQKRFSKKKKKEEEEEEGETQTKRFIALLL